MEDMKKEEWWVGSGPGGWRAISHPLIWKVIQKSPKSHPKFTQNVIQESSNINPKVIQKSGSLPPPYFYKPAYPLLLVHHEKSLDNQLYVSIQSIFLEQQDKDAPSTNIVGAFKFNACDFSTSETKTFWRFRLTTLNASTVWNLLRSADVWHSQTFLRETVGTESKQPVPHPC